MPCGCSDDCDCAEALEHLFAYIDAEMSANELAKISQHIGHCPDCGYEEQLARHYKELVHRCCSQCEPAPEELKIRVIRQLHAWSSREGAMGASVVSSVTTTVASSVSVGS